MAQEFRMSPMKPEQDPTSGEYYYRTRWSRLPMKKFGDGSGGLDGNRNLVAAFFHSEIARDSGIERRVGEFRRFVQTLLSPKPSQ